MILVIYNTLLILFNIMLNFYKKSMLCFRSLTQKHIFNPWLIKTYFNLFSQSSCPFLSAKFTTIYLHTLGQISPYIKIVYKDTKYYWLLFNINNINNMAPKGIPKVLWLLHFFLPDLIQRSFLSLVSFRSKLKKSTFRGSGNVYKYCRMTKDNLSYAFNNKVYINFEFHNILGENKTNMSLFNN